MSTAGMPFRRGREGEALAARYLETRGWRVLDRNWRDGPRELDLVAEREGVLAFVEVKTRGDGSWGHPLDALTPRKRREVERAARAWLRRKQGTPRAAVGRPPAQIRFDAVVVRLEATGEPGIHHVPDAWRPGWGS